jgi:hypothetical protein
VAAVGRQGVWGGGAGGRPRGSEQVPRVRVADLAPERIEDVHPAALGPPRARPAGPVSSSEAQGVVNLFCEHPKIILGSLQFESGVEQGRGGSGYRIHRPGSLISTG